MNFLKRILYGENWSRFGRWYLIALVAFIVIGIIVSEIKLSPTPVPFNEEYR